MKSKLNTILATACLVWLTGCGIISSLPPTNYAELRVGDGDKRQLLIESDEWQGVINMDAKHGFRHRTCCWFSLQGDGPIYTLNEDEGHGYKSVGTITIDKERKDATIDLRHVPYGVGESMPFLYNGTYQLALITHAPFYTDDNRK
jgi:hypothetical protein